MDQGASFGIVSRRPLKKHDFVFIFYVVIHLLCFSGLQYFDCLPPKYGTWRRHSIREMISASRRIFWHSFQPSIKKKHEFSVSILMFLCDVIPQNIIFLTKLSFEICSKQLSTMRNRFLILPKPETLHFNEFLRL